MQADCLLTCINRHDTTASLRYQAVERVILAMHKRLGETLSLQDMAAIAGLSPYHFNRVFRQITGIPPSQFLYALRLEAAKRLILTTQLSITEVCYKVGYNSLGTFVTRFTQLVGLSPRQLRRLAEQPTMPCYKLLYEHTTDLSSIIPQTPGITGRISTPNAFTGLIFVGLFAKPIPQSPPVGCTVLTAPGIYHIATPPNDGYYYLFAAAISQSADRFAYLLHDTSLRGSAEPLLVCGSQVSGQADITLNPAQLTHPPLLVALPFLRSRCWSTQSTTISDQTAKKAK